MVSFVTDKLNLNKKCSFLLNTRLLVQFKVVYRNISYILGKYELSIFSYSD